mgnify:CR=1 FL=1
MSDKIVVMESIALRGMAKYGNIKRGIRDMQSIDDYAVDSASNETTGEVLVNYLKKGKVANEKQTASIVAAITKLNDRLDSLEAK